MPAAAASSGPTPTVAAEPAPSRPASTGRRGDSGRAGPGAAGPRDQRRRRAAAAAASRRRPARIQLLMTARDQKGLTTMSRPIILAAVSRPRPRHRRLRRRSRARLTAAQQLQRLFGPPAGRRAHQLRLRRRQPTAIGVPGRRAGAGSPPGSSRSASLWRPHHHRRAAAATHRPAPRRDVAEVAAELWPAARRGRRAGHRGRGRAGHDPRRRQPLDRARVPAAPTGATRASTRRCAPAPITAARSTPTWPR